VVKDILLKKIVGRRIVHNITKKRIEILSRRRTPGGWKMVEMFVTLGKVNLMKTQVVSVRRLLRLPNRMAFQWLLRKNLLGNRRTRTDLLKFVIRERSTADVQWLVKRWGERDPVISNTGKNGYSPLMEALGPSRRANNFEIARWLVADGRVEIMFPTYGGTAVFVAAMHQDARLVINLVEVVGANVDVVGYGGETMWSRLDFPAAMTEELLRTLLPRLALPAEVREVLLASEFRDLVVEGMRLQRRMESFLRERRAIFDETLSTIPLDLCNMIFDLIKDLTTDDMWAMDEE
jgi:hypothetical protein